MDLSNSLAYVLYPIYNQLAIHDAPLFILDLFLPILTTSSWEEALRKDMKGAKTFENIDDLFRDLRTPKKREVRH